MQNRAAKWLVTDPSDNVTPNIRMPNPRRVAAGRLNRAKRKAELSAATRKRLSELAKANKPWLRATGPKTAEGKARAAKNGRSKQAGPKSIRAVKRELKELQSLLDEMQVARLAAEFG